jgi:4-amino-4-deoxy-L-arabinose transferase-like glycosyltransferase
MPNLDVDRLIRGWRGPALAALLALVAGLPGLIALPPLDRDESRFAEATAQMLETRDFTNIQFQDEPRHKKPVGIHWLQALAVGVFSNAEARQIWAYRIPSLLGAMLAAAACAWGAARWFGQRSGVLSGLILGATFLLSTEASIAKTDAVLCGATTLALATLGRMYAAAKDGEPIKRRLKLVFWFAIAVTILVKGPIGPLVAGLTLLTLGLWDREWGWIRRIGWLWGLIIVAGVCGPWALAITVATDGSFWSTAVTSDLASKVAGGQESHGAPPGYHTILAPLLFFPGSLLLAAAVMTAWRRRAEPAVRFAIAWLAPSWIVFELAPTKLVHYTLPLYGALAWLVVAALTQPIGTISRRTGLGLGIFAGVGVAALAVVVCAQYGHGADWVWAGFAVLFALAAAAGGGFLLMTHRETKALLVSIGCGVLAHACIASALAPSLKPLWPSREMARALKRNHLDPRNGVTPAPVAVLGFAEPSIVFLLGTDTEIADPDDAADAVAEGRPVIVEAKQEPAFRAELAKARLEVQPVAVVKGVNYSKGKPVTLTLYRSVKTQAQTQAKTR